MYTQPQKTNLSWLLVHIQLLQTCELHIILWLVSLDIGLQFILEPTIVLLLGQQHGLNKLRSKLHTSTAGNPSLKW